MDSQDGKKKGKGALSAGRRDSLSEVTDTEATGSSDVEVYDLPFTMTREFVLFPTGIIVIKTEDFLTSKAVLTASRHDNRLFVYSTTDVPKKNAEGKYVVEDKDFGDETGNSMGGLIGAICTEAEILKVSRLSGEERGVMATLRGIRRMKIVMPRLCRNGALSARACTVDEIPLAVLGEDVYRDQSLLRAVRNAARGFIESQVSNQNLKDILKLIEQSRDPGALADFLGGHLDMPSSIREKLIQTLSVRDRLKILLDVFTSQSEASVAYKEAAQKVRTDIDRQQRDYFIRQHIKALREQIEDKEGDATGEDAEFAKQVRELEAPEEVKTYVEKQWKRLSFLPQASAEYSVARAHIEVILDIPWMKKTTDRLDLAEARRILDEDHFGLEEVKERIVEYLSVLALRKDMKSPILCLYGPPGVGKTSIGKSVARALGRRFERISLGGIHDECEIRGHRRTYVAAMPGRITQALRRAKTMNPVILLDEIDKLTVSNHGDPSSALLEVLDPEQHNAFVDSYVETPIDLSDVLFMTTANSLETISGPLRDRMEIIELPSYTQIDKRTIVNDFLLPKLLERHGLNKSHLSLNQDALDDIISLYTREAGVRQLEQRLSALCRKVAVHVVESQQVGKKRAHVTVTRKKLPSLLGKPRYDFDVIEPDRLPGISTGLAWTPVGGDILFIETTSMPGKGNLVITGKLGDVMQESVRAAMTLIRARAPQLGLDLDVSQIDVHVHVPAGATPKDGPSAGAAIFTAILSLFKNIPVPAELAMTGEISLRGNILPVGGIREKVLAAHRSGIRTVILPFKNEKDLDEIPEVVRSEMKFHLVKTIDEVIGLVFG